MAEPFLRIVDKDSNTEVLRITATEIVVDPNVSVDDAARRVFEALQGYFNLAAEEQASRIRVEALEEAAAFTRTQAQAFRDDAHNKKQFGDRMMHKRGLAVAAYFHQHAAAIRALIPKEKPHE